MHGFSPGSTRRRRPIQGHMRRSLISTLVAVPALVALVACSTTPPVQPNVPVASTQAAAAATLVASPAATAAAIASPAVATISAAAGAALTGSPAASPSPSPSPSPAARGGIGSLRIADASLADATPWLSIQNDGEEPIEVGGWQLQVGTATAALPENAVVPPGGTLTLHAGSGLSSDDELFLGDTGNALVAAAQPGAPVRLTNATGTVVSEVTVPRF